MSRYKKGKTDLDFTEARDSEWQWHQLGHMQVCNSLQTDNHASTPPLSFFTGRMPFLPPNQQRQSTEGTESIFQIYIESIFYTLVYAVLCISVLVTSVLIWSVTQSSEPNQRTNDATCWLNPWTEWAGSRSSHAHQTRSRVRWRSSHWPGPAHPSAQCGGSVCNIAERHNVESAPWSGWLMIMQSYGWNLQQLQHSWNKINKCFNAGGWKDIGPVQKTCASFSD